jgi:hypothetical protein
MMQPMPAAHAIRGEAHGSPGPECRGEMTGAAHFERTPGPLSLKRAIQDSPIPNEDA